MTKLKEKTQMNHDLKARNSDTKTSNDFFNAILSPKVLSFEIKEENWILHLFIHLDTQIPTQIHSV